MECWKRFLSEVSSVSLLSSFTQISLTVAAKELSVSDTDVSEVSWTDNGTFNLSEGYTPQTDTSDGMLTRPYSSFDICILGTWKRYAPGLG